MNVAAGIPECINPFTEQCVPLTDKVDKIQVIQCNFHALTPFLFVQYTKNNWSTKLTIIAKCVTFLFVNLVDEIIG